MKLTELAIEGYGNFRHLNLGRFSDGINFVYGEKGAGKTALRQFIRNVLFGFESNDGENGFSAASIAHSAPTTVGHLGIRSGIDEYRIDRESLITGHLRVQQIAGSPLNGNPVDHSSTNVIETVQRLAGKIDPAVYDCVYSFSNRQTRENAPRLSQVLHSRLNVPRGATAAGDDVGYLNWKRESETRITNLTTLKQRIDELQRDRENCQATISNSDTTHRNRLTQIENEIQTVSNQINNADVGARRNQLAAIDREIADLRAIIDKSITHVAYAPTVTEANPFATLYQRLDEIDNQIRRWRRVQTDIQSQRVRLKDEMVVWNDLTLESADHPYHNAREILVRLETKVDEADRQAKGWNQSATRNSDPAQTSANMHQLCNQMRDDLYGLCQELAQQYKHIRHKAAAAELKQLRRCYNEMGENTQRLVRRRDEAINDIRTVDPAGADAIARSESDFCQCAMHEGYLEARRKHVGAAPATPAQQISHRVIQPDLSAERNRLSQLDSQRKEILATLVHSESELARLKTHHAELSRQREVIRCELDTHSLTEKIRRIDLDLASLTEEHQRLLRMIEEDHRYVRPASNTILVRAAAVLHRLTLGELVQVFIADAALDSYNELNNAADFQIRNRVGTVLNFSALNPSQQDLVYLSLVVATSEAMRQQLIASPIVIDDAFANIKNEEINATIDVLNELAHAGQQVILLSQHRFLADRIPSAKLFDLDSARLDSNRVDSPQYTTVETRLPALPTVSSQYDSGIDNGSVRENGYYSSEYISSLGIDPTMGSDVTTSTHDDSPQLAPNSYLDSTTNSDSSAYPFSKYQPIDDIIDRTERMEQTSYIVPHPVMNRQQVLPTLSATPTASVSTVPVQQIADPIGFAVSVDDHTLLERVEILELNHLRALSSVDVETVGQLLEIEPSNMPAGLRSAGISPDQIDRWQSRIWLLSNVPGLRIGDAKVLVACGVTEPEHLATSHASQLNERVQRFLNSSEGQRYSKYGNSISLDRINGWYRGLESTRSRWDRGEGYSRRSRRRNGNRSNGQYESRSGNRDRDQRAEREHRQQGQRGQQDLRENQSRDSNRSQREPREYQRNERTVRALPERTPRAVTERTRTQRPMREPMVARPPRMKTPESRQTAPALAPVTKKKSTKPATKKSSGSKMRFYLDLNDHIEAAPSIGPKTAERFEKIGVFTVADFLKQTAESMSTKLKYKRLTADVVRQWQHQARLVCRIPNLRGHDAQLLVACDFTEAEEIGTLQPTKLFEVIGPFSETKDGLKIIRNGKKPDLEEITDWISWAAHTRSLQAA